MEFLMLNILFTASILSFALSTISYAGGPASIKNVVCDTVVQQPDPNWTSGPTGNGKQSQGSFKLVLDQTYAKLGISMYNGDVTVDGIDFSVQAVSQNTSDTQFDFLVMISDGTRTVRSNVPLDLTKPNPTANLIWNEKVDLPANVISPVKDYNITCSVSPLANGKR